MCRSMAVSTPVSEKYHNPNFADSGVTPATVVTGDLSASPRCARAVIYCHATKTRLHRLR
jgi:hypothetical protein